jgi:hypothetical protein
MANWVDQDFHVVGRKPAVDRFVRAGYVRHRRGEVDDLLYLDKLCPPTRTEKRAEDSPDLAVVLALFRTRTQAMFTMQTRSDYPAGFYRRLPARWPELAFAASVNEEMGSFGGIVIALDGEVIDLVRDYGAGYNRRAHAREIRRALDRWDARLTGDRPWRVMPDAPWKHLSTPVDAHLDDGWWLYFRTREEMAAFRARYPSSHPMRREGREWRRTRYPAR